MENTINVRVKNVPLATYLDLLSRQAGVKFILADGLEGVRVTAFLQDVAAREALELLKATQGLTYRRTGSGSAIMIAPAAKGAKERRTKVYQLQNAGSPGH